MYQVLRLCVLKRSRHECVKSNLNKNLLLKTFTRKSLFNFSAVSYKVCGENLFRPTQRFYYTVKVYIN